MMRWRSFTRSLVVAAVSGACRASEPGGVALDISANPRSVQLGQSVSITVRVVNNSSRTITAWAPGFYGFCDHAFRVFDAQDREVAVPSGLCAAFKQSFCRFFRRGNVVHILICQQAEFRLIGHEEIGE